MSEEEIIKEIEIIKAIQNVMQHNLDIYPPKEDIYKLDTKQLKAIICLLDLYKREKSRIIELTELLDKQENEIRSLQQELEIEKGCSISKDKIREKIEYIRENYNEFYECSVYKSIEFLQELLEE